MATAPQAVPFSVEQTMFVLQHPQFQGGGKVSALVTAYLRCVANDNTPQDGSPQQLMNAQPDMHSSVPASFTLEQAYNHYEKCDWCKHHWRQLVDYQAQF